MKRSIFSNRMAARALRLAATTFAVFAMVGWTAIASAGNNSNGAGLDCEKIKADFVGMNVVVFPSGMPCTSPLGLCALNTLTGDLQGVAEVTATAAPATPEAQYLSSESLFLLDNGDTLISRDVGALDLINGKSVANLSIIGGTGEWENASGNLVVKGTVDFPGGTSSGKLSGKICTPDDD